MVGLPVDRSESVVVPFVVFLEPCKHGGSSCGFPQVSGIMVGYVRILNLERDPAGRNHRDHFCQTTGCFESGCCMVVRMDVQCLYFCQLVPLLSVILMSPYVFPLLTEGISVGRFLLFQIPRHIPRIMQRLRVPFERGQ
jgi:hypothetical protein